MKAKHILRGILGITMLILTSCIRDDIEIPNTPQDHQVTFSLQMPRALASAPGTGLTEEEEREINELTVLLFTETPSGPVYKKTLEALPQRLCLTPAMPNIP